MTADDKLCSNVLRVGVLVAEGLDTVAVTLLRPPPKLVAGAGGELNAVAVDVGGVLDTLAPGVWS